MTLTVRRLSGYIGAEISDVDLNTLSADTLAEIRATFLEHLVLFFPRQHLSADALVGFASSFGEVEPLRPDMIPNPDNPKVMRLVSKDGGGSGKFNDTWHADVTFFRRPPAATVIQADTIPERGGDTVYASLYAAYESLSEPLRFMIQDMEVLHDGIPSFSTYLLDPSVTNGRERLEHLKSTAEVAAHPLVTRHPETGRKLLYLNRTFAVRILGLSDIESRNLLALLFEHVEQASFQMRWRWSEGDVGIWDNRCALHYASKDYTPALRIMDRITIKGDQPIPAH